MGSRKVRYSYTAELWWYNYFYLVTVQREVSAKTSFCDELIAWAQNGKMISYMQSEKKAVFTGTFIHITFQIFLKIIGKRQTSEFLREFTISVSCVSEETFSQIPHFWKPHLAKLSEENKSLQNFYIDKCHRYAILLGHFLLR